MALGPTRDQMVTETDDAIQLCRYATDRSPLPLVFLEGPQHLVRYANPAFCRLAGRAREQLVGRPFPAAAQPEPEQCFADLLDSVYGTGGTASLQDQDRTDASARGPRWSYTAWGVCGEKGHPTGVMLQVTDTTQTHHARLLASDLAEALVLSDVRQHEEAEAGSQRLRLALREVDHRIKNNLQIVGSLLETLAQEGNEVLPVAVFDRLRMHVRALAAVHAVLARGMADDDAVGRVPVRTALQEVLTMWQQIAFASDVRWSVDDVHLPAKQCVSIAMLVNELVNNAIKHGGNTIRVRLATQEPNGATLEVTDNGPGFPPAFGVATHANFGLEMVQSVASVDLRGAMTCENRPQGGACVTICFPVEA